MRLLVTGGREWADEDAIRRCLFSFYFYAAQDEKEHPILIHGDARGADRIADRIGKEIGYTVVAMPADWEKDGRAAGPIRNQKMLDEWAPTHVVAFPDKKSRGTWDMVKRAVGAGLGVKVYDVATATFYDYIKPNRAQTTNYPVEPGFLDGDFR